MWTCSVSQRDVISIVGFFSLASKPNYECLVSRRVVLADWLLVFFACAILIDLLFWLCWLSVERVIGNMIQIMFIEFGFPSESVQRNQKLFRFISSIGWTNIFLSLYTKRCRQNKLSFRGVSVGKCDFSLDKVEWNYWFFNQLPLFRLLYAVSIHLLPTFWCWIRVCISVHTLTQWFSLETQF